MTSQASPFGQSLSQQGGFSGQNNAQQSQQMPQQQFGGYGQQMGGFGGGYGGYGGGFGGGFNPMFGGIGGLGFNPMMGAQFMQPMMGGYGGGFGGYPMMGGFGGFGGYPQQMMGFGGGYNPMFGGLGSMGMNPMMGPQFMQPMYGRQQFGDTAQRMYGQQMQMDGGYAGGSPVHNEHMAPGYEFRATPEQLQKFNRQNEIDRNAGPVLNTSTAPSVPQVFGQQTTPNQDAPSGIGTPGYAAGGYGFSGFAPQLPPGYSSGPVDARGSVPFGLPFFM